MSRASPARKRSPFDSKVDDDEGAADAVDKYGRFVGNIRVGDVDVNLEILRRGWALVSLYNSMRRGEIRACPDAWATGRTPTGGIAARLTQSIGTFDHQLVYRKVTGAPPSEGKRRFMHPKLFRRQCTWWAYRQKGTFRPGFDTFLRLSKDDVFYGLDDFLSGLSERRAPGANREGGRGR